MVLDFEGIIDARGLQALQQCSDSLRLPSRRGAAVRFWAALDHRLATQVLREMLAGDRGRALRLLEEFCVAIGSKPDRR